MRQHHFFFVLIAFVGSWLAAFAVAQAQPAGWSLTTSGYRDADSGAGIVSMAADSSGNLFVLGYFRGTVWLSGHRLERPSGGGIFVAKRRPGEAGFAWVAQGGGSYHDRPGHLAVEGHNVYVTGLFSDSSAGFGAVRLPNRGYELTGFNHNEYYVAKLRDEGQTGRFVWARRASSVRDEYDEGLAVRGRDVYIAGVFSGPTLDIGTDTLHGVTGFDAFLAHLVDEGDSSRVVWVQRPGGTRDVTLSELAIAPDGLYLTGTAGSLLPRDGGPVADPYPVTGSFITKLTDLDRSPRPVWVKTLGQAGAQLGISHLVVQGRYIYVAGTFHRGNASAGSQLLFVVGAVPRAPSGSASGTSSYVARLVDEGTTVRVDWTQHLGRGFVPLEALAADEAGVYVAGTFNRTTLPLGDWLLVNAAQVPPDEFATSDAFVAYLTGTGATASVAVAARWGTAGYDEALAVARHGQAVSVGGHLRTADIGTGLRRASILLATGPAGPGSPPVLRQATVVLPSTLAALSILVVVRNALGQVVRQASAAGFATASLPVSLAGLPAGVYSWQVRVGDNSTVSCLVVE